MVNRELICPQSIVVVGGSNNVHKPGGRLVRNLLDGKYKGSLYVVNAKETDVQGLKSYHSVQDIPETEMAILSIPSKACVEVVDVLAHQKNVKAFIIISAGFGEETKEGGQLEDQILHTINEVGASLIGPNCIGLMNIHFHGVFTQPIPEFRISIEQRITVLICLVGRKLQTIRCGRYSGIHGPEFQRSHGFQNQDALYRTDQRSRQTLVSCFFVNPQRM